MLKPDELTGALHAALKACDPPCKRLCVASARIEDDKYVLAHNGLGDRDSDWQTVYAPGVLGLSKDGLAAKLRPWVEGLHRGERVDLNAVMSNSCGSWGIETGPHQNVGILIPSAAAWRWTDGTAP